MRVLSFLILVLVQLSSLVFAEGVLLCPSYLRLDGNGNSIAIPRVESFLGKQTLIYDVSDYVTERRALSDPKLRIYDLSKVFNEGKLFLGFGRPNVFIGIPGVEEQKLGYAKVDAKSLWRDDTKLTPTLDFVQSGLLMVFPEASPEMIQRVTEAAKAHEGTQHFTCVNSNCRILSDAGFTIGGESLSNYYFPVRLFSDIMRYGLEFDGRPVKFDIIKTTPGYLDDIALSIAHAVGTTVCRHTERACTPFINQIKKNSYMLKIRDGIRETFGIAIYNDPGRLPPLDRPRWESQIARISIPEDQQVLYDMDVSEPSRFGTMLRLLWGPHALHEVHLPPGLVDQFLPDVLTAYPNPSFLSKIKMNGPFSPPMIGLMRAHLAPNYKRVSGIPHNYLLDMLRVHSAEIPNKYNFVVTGDRLIIMKIDIFSGAVDWILSKHVLMSGYSDDVRIAGEVWKTADGTLHFNIDSGTYQPNEEKVLIPATGLVRALVPGIPVVAHGRTK